MEVADRLLRSHTGRWLQSRHRLSLVDHRHRAAISVVQMVRRGEAETAKLVALVFVI